MEIQFSPSEHGHSGYRQEYGDQQEDSAQIPVPTRNGSGARAETPPGFGTRHLGKGLRKQVTEAVQQKVPATVLPQGMSYSDGVSSCTPMYQSKQSPLRWHESSARLLARKATRLLFNQEEAIRRSMVLLNDGQEMLCPKHAPAGFYPLRHGHKMFLRQHAGLCSSSPSGHSCEDGCTVCNMVIDSVRRRGNSPDDSDGRLIRRRTTLCGSSQAVLADCSRLASSALSGWRIP